MKSTSSKSVRAPRGGGEEKDIKSARVTTLRDTRFLVGLIPAANLPGRSRVGVQYFTEFYEWMQGLSDLPSSPQTALADCSAPNQQDLLLLTLPRPELYLHYDRLLHPLPIVCLRFR